MVICAGMGLTLMLGAACMAGQWYLWENALFPWYVFLTSPALTAIMGVLGVRAARRMSADLPNAPAADLAETLRALQARGNPAAREIASRLAREWGFRGTEVMPAGEPVGDGTEVSPAGSPLH
jgi:hypothetical protein